MQDLLSEFCISGEHSEFTYINKVCTVTPQILGVLVDGQGDYPVPSCTDQGKFFRCVVRVAYLIY